MKLPQNREDWHFLEDQPNLTKEEIIKNTKELLIWIQDRHWGTYEVIISLLQPLVNDIKEDLFEQLKSNDPEWSDAIISGLFLRNENKLDEDIYDFLESILPVEETEENNYWIIQKVLELRKRT